MAVDIYRRAGKAGERVNAVVVEGIDKEEWDRLVCRFLDYNFRQMWSYADVLARKQGAKHEHVAVRAGGEVVGLADVRLKHLPLLRGGLAYVSGGPLIRRGELDDLKRAETCITALEREYIKRRGMTLRIAPSTGVKDYNTGLADLLVRRGYSVTGKSAPPYRTFLLDVTRGEDVIRAGFEQKWRNQLNAAQRQNLDVSLGVDVEMLDRFNVLLDALVRRKGFSIPLDGRFYSEVQAGASPSERLVVCIVGSGGELHAGGVFAMNGDTCVYILGATAEAGLKSKASYLLQWAIIHEAKARGIRVYDLGGVNPETNPGVFSFKKGLGGEEIVINNYEKHPTGLRAFFMLGAERIYRLLLARAQ
jgi:lipid II:glycine glycyltransferase (peptidoglycan interpeptide bridge formation enzyme)